MSSTASVGRTPTGNHLHTTHVGAVSAAHDERWIEFREVSEYLDARPEARVTASFVAAVIHRDPRRVVAALDLLAASGLTCRELAIHCEDRRIKHLPGDSERIPDTIYCDLHDEEHPRDDLDVRVVYSHAASVQRNA